MMGRTQQIRTIADDLDAGYKLKDPDDVTAADLNPLFIRVQTMTKGEVFGLVEVVLGRQPSFSVISSGAECVLLDKKFYLQNLPVDQLRRVALEVLITNLKLAHECSPYPTDEEMQNKLQESFNWKQYKTDSLIKTLSKIRPTLKL